VSNMTIWILLRAAGIGAYGMLYLSVAWGLVSTTSIVTKRVSKPSSILFHQFVATVGVTLIGVHVTLLVIDSFMPFGWIDVLVPMHATFRPIATTLGVLGMYGAVIVLVTSWLRRPIGTKVWRAIHLLAIPAFALSLAHGVLTGTDTGRAWMWGLYAYSGLSVLFLVLVRGFTYGYRPPRAAPPQRRPTAGGSEGPVLAGRESH
jgi:sulfoxide reductase heme-binding subunit YedZ